MARLLLIVILAGLAFLQNISPPVANFIGANIEAINAARARGSFNDSPYVFGGMAPNPFAYEFCPERYCPPTEVVIKPRRVVICDTPTPTISTPVETPVPTETLTETLEPWACPVIGDLSEKAYKKLCMKACNVKKCKQECEKCWSEQ